MSRINASTTSDVQNLHPAHGHRAGSSSSRISRTTSNMSGHASADACVAECERWHHGQCFAPNSRCAPRMCAPRSRTGLRAQHTRAADVVAQVLRAAGPRAVREPAAHEARDALEVAVAPLYRAEGVHAAAPGV